MTASGHITRLLCLLGSAAALAACNPPPPKEKPADPKACTEYATKLCAEMGGDESPTCASTKQTLDLLPPAACAAGLKDVAFTKTKLGDARKKCDELENKLCAALGDKTQTCEMVRTQTKNFPPERCEMMLGRYDEVLKDLQKMEARNKPLAAEQLSAIAGGTDVPAFGPTDAKVTIVEFSDFQCPFCSRAANAAHQVKEKYGDKVRFVFRQFPLSFHQNAHVAAEASLEAHRQGKFWELHDKMFADQQKLDRASLEATAKEIGLDMAAFKKALDDKTHAAAVDAEMKLGESVAVDGTPTMFLNGKRVGNPTDFDALSKEIDAALAGG
jgi:protein-disulfide isomerase